MTDLIREIRAHALAHYNDGGWDVIVEAWEDKDIADAIGKARTLAGALRKLRPVIGVYADRQADAVISAGGPDLQPPDDGFVERGVPDETCPHGLSLWLCVDPVNHYPPDNYF